MRAAIQKRDQELRARNEALDLAVYALAALYSLHPIGWEKLAENRIAQRPEPSADESGEVATDAAPAESSPAQAPRPRIAIPRRSFATSW
jgi:phage terminase large subunit GpA-like protein